MAWADISVTDKAKARISLVHHQFQSCTAFRATEGSANTRSNVFDRARRTYSFAIGKTPAGPPAAATTAAHQGANRRSLARTMALENCTLVPGLAVVPTGVVLPGARRN